MLYRICILLVNLDVVPLLTCSNITVCGTHGLATSCHFTVSSRSYSNPAIHIPPAILHTKPTLLCYTILTPLFFFSREQFQCIVLSTELHIKLAASHSVYLARIVTIVLCCSYEAGFALFFWKKKEKKKNPRSEIVCDCNNVSLHPITSVILWKSLQACRMYIV